MRKITANLALPFILLIVILALLELYFRLFDPQSLRLSRPDPVLGWVHVANTEGLWQKDCFSARLRFNSEGMRDVEHAIAKPEGTYRIAVIGDSIVTGQEVDLEETVYRRLEAVLQGAGRDVEVLGFAVRGFGTDQEYRLLEHYALKYEPDLVVLVFTGNDIRNNSLTLEKNPGKPYFELAPDGTLVARPFTPMPDHSNTWKSILFENLHLVRFVYFRVGKIPWVHNALVKFGVYANVITEPGGGDDLGKYNEYRALPWSAEWEEAWRLTQSILLEFRARTERAGARFILLGVANTMQLSDEDFDKLRNDYPHIPLDRDIVHKRLASFSAAEGIDYLPSLPAMRELQAAGTEVRLSCDGHWSREAHQRAAEILAGYITAGDYFRE